MRKMTAAAVKAASREAANSMSLNYGLGSSK